MNSEIELMLAKIVSVGALTVFAFCMAILLADMHGTYCIWKKAPRWVRRHMTPLRHRLAMAGTLMPLSVLAGMKAVMLGMAMSAPHWPDAAFRAVLTVVAVGFVAFHPFQGALETTPGGPGA